LTGARALAYDAAMLVAGYSDFEYQTPFPLRRPGLPVHGHTASARFRLDQDVSSLFPYINAAVEQTRYTARPHQIQLVLDEVSVTLLPQEATAAPFTSAAEAHAFAARLLDFLNDLHARKDTLVPDHGKFKPVPALPIFKLLPRSNCGACGFPTCMAFASALGIGETGLDLCTELTDQKARDSIAAMWETD